MRTEEEILIFVYTFTLVNNHKYPVTCIAQENHPTAIIIGYTRLQDEERDVGLHQPCEVWQTSLSNFRPSKYKLCKSVYTLPNAQKSYFWEAGSFEKNTLCDLILNVV